MRCAGSRMLLAKGRAHTKPDVTLGIGRDGSNNNDYILEQDDQLEENESLSFVEFDAERAPARVGC
ncbi:hypothetical protein PR002_g32601 [Phytophthora rubi]|uniref:Uncharacterized protein n=1 Tax=Phytophthora rubi TaxID=129364 RepID=A0A6A3G802_9STRA|nr:hypothetical protein PR002_g32601 [Phytophthora rubi]